MFSNLSKGNVLYGLDRRGQITWFTASIDRVTPSIGMQNPNMFGQLPEVRLDIIANINGEQREFKQVPSNNAIADFGDNSFIIADNKDSLYNYVKSLLQTSENIVNSADTHKALIPQYKTILGELMPGSNNSAEVKELKEQVSALQGQLAETLSLLKSVTNKTE